jgi:hypothetical protein
VAGGVGAVPVCASARCHHGAASVAMAPADWRSTLRRLAGAEVADAGGFTGTGMDMNEIRGLR